LIENNIKILYRDGHPLNGLTTIVQDTSADVFVPVDILEKGDKLTLVTQNSDSSEDTYRDSIFLSPNEKRIFKNLTIEAEIEFVKEESSPKQWVEFLARGISRWDKNFTIDESYIFGYKDGDFYFGKRGYHEEGDRSYAYKQLFDLTAPGDDTRRYFQNISDEQKEELQIRNDILDYNEKYIFRCEINEDVVKMQIRNVSKDLTQFQHYKWITIFEGVSIRQTVDDVTNVTMDIEGSISVFEPFSVIDGEGVFGFSVPNSHLKMYRFLVEDLDERTPQDYYTDEQFSRQVSSEFSMSMNEFEGLQMNAVKPGEELKASFIEKWGVEGNRVPVPSSINTEDVKKVEINDVEVKLGDVFQEGTVDVLQKMSPDHYGNKIVCQYDQEQTESFRQKEVYFDLDYETNGVSDTFDVPQEVFDTLETYHNAKVAEVLIEMDANVINNDYDRVGLKEDNTKFIGKEQLNELYSGRKFYMETDIRGVDTTIEMGTVVPNDYTFVIEDQYLETSDSYEAIWNYNLANFVNQIISDFAEFIIEGTPGQRGVIASTLSLGITGEDEGYTIADVSELAFTLKDALFSEYGTSLGEAVALVPQELFDYIFEVSPTPLFIQSDLIVDSTIKRFLNDERVKESYIKVLCYFAQNVNVADIRNIVKFVKKKDTVFDQFLIDFMTTLDTDIYQSYIDFRGVWLRDIQFNRVISSKGVGGRKFYKSLLTDEYLFQDGNIVFNYVPKVSKRIKVRIYYDLAFELTNSYQEVDRQYEVPDAVKELSKRTNNEKGVNELFEFINTENSKYYVDEGIPFVILPKAQNPFNDELFLDIKYCPPYVGDSDTVIKYAKVPLKRVNRLINNDFEDSQYGEIYPYTQTQSFGDLETFCTSVCAVSGKDISGFTVYELQDHCFDTALDRSCFVATGFSNGSLAAEITANEYIENREVFNEWNRDYDVLDLRTECLSGFWNRCYTAGYELEDYTSPDGLIYTDSIVGDLYEGFAAIPSISGTYALDVLSMGISGIDAFITMGISGQMQFKYDYPRYYALEDGLFSDVINEHYVVEETYLKKLIEDDEDTLSSDEEVSFPLGKNIPNIDTRGDALSFNPYIKKFMNIGINDEEFLPRKDLMDKFYKVSDWFELNHSKVGDYNRDVLRTIIKYKTQNRYDGEKQAVSSDASPFNLNNWFDGYYTGKRLPFYDLYTMPSSIMSINDEGQIEFKTVQQSVDDYSITDKGGVGISVDAAFASVILNTDVETMLESNDFTQPQNQPIEATPLGAQRIFSLDVGEGGIQSVYWESTKDGALELHGSNDGYISGMTYLLTMDAGTDFLAARYDYRYYGIFSAGTGPISLKRLFLFRDDFNMRKLDPRYVHFGRYYGNPWGQQSSRKQIIEQTRDTLDEKFPDYDLYYGDMTKFYHPEKRTEIGDDYNYWDVSQFRKTPCYATADIASPSVMGISGTDTTLFIENPYVDPNLSLYKFNQDVVVNGELVFDNDDLSNVTNVKKLYSSDNAFAVDRTKVSIDILGVGKKLQKGRDLFWSYDATLKLKPEVLDVLPIDAVISIEYEYTMNEDTENENTPTRISQRVVLGRVNGDSDQTFYNPAYAIRQENVDMLNIHRMWIDNIEIKEFEVVQSTGDNYFVDFKVPELLMGKKQVGVVYRDDNYQDLKESNKFVQKFISSDDTPWRWIAFARDENGYVKKEEIYTTFVIDEDKYDSDVVFRLSDIALEEVKTTDVAFGGELIKPIQYGRDDEDIIQLNTLKRKNNFIMSFDFIYDEDIERELMRFDIFFKGLFTTVNGVQQLTNYYAIVFGLDKGISLVERNMSVTGGIDEVILAQIQDIGAILKRGRFYTVKMELIKNDFRLYFTERGQNERYFFSTHLQFGHESSNAEITAENKYGDLNVIYKNPNAFIDGDRIALKALTPKVNFANFSVEFLDPSNLTFGNPFVVTNYDTIISSLKNDFKLDGDIKSFKRLTTGYEYVQIGDRILSRRVDGEFVLHTMIIDKFEVSKDKCFIQERVNEDAPMTVINVYEEGFKLVQNIVVNGKQLTNESFVSFLAETNQRATNIEKIDGKLFITIDNITGQDIIDEELTWDQLDATWEEYYAPWNLF